MNARTKYVLNLLTILTALIFSAVTIFGWNKFVDAVGGLRSFGGLIALTILGLGFVGTIVWLRIAAFTGFDRVVVRDVIAAFFILLALGAIGWNWIDLPTGAGVKVLVGLIISAIAALITTWVGYVDE